MKNRNIIYLLLILAAGLILRVYNINTGYYFTGELGKELLYIREFAIKGTLPLVGMATSHSWLSYGPIYYWLMLPIYYFSQSPFILFWTALIVSVVGLILNYIIVNKIVDQKVALLSTLIQSLSPLFIWQTQLSKLHIFFFILSPLFMYLLYLVWNGKKKIVFWAGLIYGIMFSFHFSQIPLLGVVVLLFWIRKDVYKLRDAVIFGLGAIIPNITLLWQDKSLALWLPYRVLSFTDKNPGRTWQALVEYTGRNIFWNQHLWIIGLIIFIFIFYKYISQNKSRLTKDFLPFYLISSVSLMFIANILHGVPPVHYFLPIFTTLPILFAVFISKLKYPYIFMLIIFLINFQGYFKSQYGVDYVPFNKQVEIVNSIVRDANGSEFTLKRMGPFDYFPENYSQNYKYLILWKGGKLNDSAGTTYTINDYTNSYTKR